MEAWIILAMVAGAFTVFRMSRFLVNSFFGIALLLSLGIGAPAAYFIASPEEKNLLATLEAAIGKSPEPLTPLEIREALLTHPDAQCVSEALDAFLVQHITRPITAKDIDRKALLCEAKKEGEAQRNALKPFINKK